MSITPDQHEDLVTFNNCALIRLEAHGQGDSLAALNHRLMLRMLNAKPVGYTTERAATYEVWNSGSASFWPESDMGDTPLYMAAPVPVVDPVLYRWWFVDKPEQVNITQADMIDILVRKPGLIIEGLAPVSREEIPR